MGFYPWKSSKISFISTVLPGEDEGYFRTMGGFVMHVLGRIPKTGDRFEVEGLNYEVIDLDGLRVDKILVTLGQREQPGPAGEITMSKEKKL